MHRLRRKKLSPNQVRRLIFDLALLGQFTKPYLDTEDEVIDFFNRQDDTQYYFDIIVEQCRDYSELVPLIEDAFGSANNSEVGKFNGKVLLSKEEILVEAPGILHMNHHLFLFSYSFNLHSALPEADTLEFVRFISPAIPWCYAIRSEWP